MTFQAKIMISLIALLNGMVIIDLLRRKKISESYSLLWLFVIFSVIVVTWSKRLLVFIAHFIGALAPVNALTLLSLAFILLMLIYFSMKISQLSTELKDFVQNTSLMIRKLKDDNELK